MLIYLNWNEAGSLLSIPSGNPWYMQGDTSIRQVVE